MERLFENDAYLDRCTATVTAATPEGIALDRTVFYPQGGGQPGDTGEIAWAGGTARIGDTRKAADDPWGVVHVPETGAPLPAPGTQVTATVDWTRRFCLMRMHTTLHLLCSLVPGDVTGGQIGDHKSRLDFNITGDQVDKADLEAALNRLIEEAHPVSLHWIDEAELDAKPEMVRTMSVKPPRGGGQMRLVEIAGVDLQPCGGTHVANTRDIGPLRVGKMESKGRQNRRINVHLAENGT